MYLLARRWQAVLTAASTCTASSPGPATHGGSCCGQPPCRPLFTSRPRQFLASYLSSRITERERRLEEEKSRKRAEHIGDLTKQAQDASGVDSTLAAIPRTPEETFSPQALAKKRRGEQEFYDAIFLYMERYGRTRRGHVEFIEAQRKRMRELGVHEDPKAYLALMDVFPKEVMRVKTMWQSEFKHYPRQQDTAIALLDTMNEHSVMPDTEMGLLISRIFGTESYVMAKYQRTMYWLPKLRHVDPWPVATLTSSGLRYDPEPSSAKQLALYALRRMCPDKETRFSTYDMEGGPGDLFVASAQSPKQQELLSALGGQVPASTVYLDGPNQVWYKKQQLQYYVLLADPTPLAREYAAHLKAEAAASVGVRQRLRPKLDEEDFSWWRKLRCLDEDCKEEAESADDGATASALVRSPSEHELPDMTILALAVASSEGASDLLMRWIRLLSAEPGNEALDRVSVVLRIRTEEAAKAEEPQRLTDSG